MKKVFITIISMLLPLMASAAVEIDGIWYNLNDNDHTAEVVASQSTQYSGIITIPSKFRYQSTYYEVTSIGNSSFEGCVNMTSISLPNSLKNIGNGAFWQCSSLNSVFIPDGVKTIGEGAFHNCFNLASVFIPNSVTSIGSSAFSNCNNLNQVFSLIQNPFSINNDVFTTYSTTTLFTPKGTKSSYLAQSGWKQFANINDENKRTIHVETAGTLPDLISDCEMYCIDELTLSGELNGTDIGFIRAMSGIKTEQEPNCLTFCDYYDVSTPGVLKVLDITNTNIVAGGGAYYAYTYNHTDDIHFYYFTETNTITECMFNKCKLEVIKLPNSVTHIQRGVFSNCLTSVTIGNNVTSIEFEAFYGYSGLSSIYVESGNNMYDSRDNCNAIIEKSTNELVVGCKNTMIPNSVTSIGNYAFQNCSGLNSITIPNSVTSIGNYAFYNCSALNSITIPNSVTSIGNYAFQNCSGLNSITIPNSVISIGNSAFDGCRGLNSIAIPKSVTSIGNDAFCNCSGLTSIIVDNGNTKYDSRDNSNAIIEKSSNTLMFGCKNTIIPNNVTSIGNNAFSGCSEFTSITIPNNVTSIGNSAFSGCSGLNSITIPNSVTSIGNYAFANCSGLSTVISEIEDPFVIDENVFYNYNKDIYTSATLIVPPGKKTAYQSKNGWKKFTNIVEAEQVGYEFEADGLRYKIGENNTVSVVSRDANYSGDIGIPSGVFYNGSYYNVNSIGSSAFEGCVELTSVSIPSSVTTIGDAAFYYCTGLTTVNIPNGVKTIGEGAFSKCSGLTSVTIPGSVTSIGTNAFFQCYALSQVTSWIENPFAIDDGVFPTSVYNNATLHVPFSKESAYKNAAGWKRFANIVEIEKKRTIHVATAGTLPNLISEYEKYYIEELTLSGELNGTDVRFIRNMSGIDYRNDGSGSMTFGNDYHDVLTSGKLKVLDITNTNIVAGGDCYYAFTYSRTDDMHTEYFTNTNSLPDLMFNKCCLESIKLPNSITSIGNSAFEGCSGLTSIDIPNSVTSIGNSAFSGCCGLTSVTIPNNVTSIGIYAFLDCSGITSFEIPNSVKNIAGGCYLAFDRTGWYNNQPNGLIYLDNCLLGYKGERPCGSLTIKEGTRLVADYAFGSYGSCQELTTVILPNSVMNIGVMAFEGCSGLTSVISLNNTPPTCTHNNYDGYTQFNSVDKLNSIVWVPKGCVNAYKEANCWKDFLNIKEITIGDLNLDNEVNEDDKNALIDFIMGKNPEGFFKSLADLNGDDKVDAADLVKLITIMNP